MRPEDRLPRRFSRRIAPVILVFCLAAPPLAGAAHAADYLSPAEVRTLMAGTTIDTVAVRTGEPMHFTFVRGGVLQGVIERDFNQISDDGKWWVLGNGRLCFQFNRFGRAKKRCPHLRRVAAGIDLHSADGAQFATWKIREFGPNAQRVAMSGTSPPAVVGQRNSAAQPADSAGPAISLPASVETSEPTITVAGRVQDGSRVVELTVNQRPIALAPDGTFTVRRGVPQGQSTIVVAAMDEWGNRSRTSMSVTRKGSAVRQQALAPANRATASPSAAPPAAPDPLAGLKFGRYHALVIGNNDYKKIQDLGTAENDAREVAGLLQRDYGFQVKLLTNATRADVIGGLAAMRATLKPDDSLLVYYAGHGVYDRLAEQGYWLPVDAEEGNPANWISTNDITTMLRVIRARHVLVVADSCYSGTLVRAVSGRIKTADAQVAWISRMLAKRARVALVSGGLEPVADGSGSHSVFAKAFIDALRSNRSVLSGESLFDAIKRPVVLNADQTPQYSDIRLAGHEGGDFLFVRKTR